MLDDGRLRDANALMLQWHAGAATIGFEAFRAWGLAALRPLLRFDSAVWGLLARHDATADAQINSAHLHRLPPAAREQFEQIRSIDLAGERPARQAMNVCVSDPIWQGPAHSALRAHAQRYGLANSVSMRFADPDAREQFIMLTRKSVAHRFAENEARQFELLAPHLMQAYTTCRRLFLDSPQIGERRSVGVAVALVDRTGVLYDQHESFLPMMRREWSDWPGERLPEAVRELTGRRAGTRWRFLGAQVLADFAPVDDLYLVTARPRHVADVLTAREGEVAERYAAGKNFREIAESLDLAPATVRSHLRNVFGKLHVRNKAQLAASLR